MRFRTITIILILTYFLGMATAYNRAIPTFESSDEAEHFLYIHSILTDRALPVIQSRDDLALEDLPTAIWNNHVHHAPLYYLIGAGLISWSERGDIDNYLLSNNVIFVRGVTENNPNKWLHSPYPSEGDTVQAVYSLRVLNTLIGVLTLCLIYVIGQRAFGQTAVALGAMAFVATIPSFIVVHASINNDALVIFFYSAGTLWLVNVWQKGTITTRDRWLISGVVVGASLAKLTGASLIGVVGVVLLGGVWRGRFRMADVLKTGALMGMGMLLLAGWWYFRNYQLYGDFFALSATQSLWGREFDLLDAYNANLWDELDRIGRSFWLMIGYRHAPLLADNRLFAYGMLVSLIGCVGLAWGRMSARVRELVIIFILICAVVGGMLIIGTTSVDISYGRILFPALPAFAALIMFGVWRLAGCWGMALLLLPLIGMTILSPRQIMDNYPQLKILTPHSEPVQDLVIEQVTVAQDQVSMGDNLRFQLVFAGMSDANPYLLATAVDAITLERLGHVEVYAGSAPTQALQPDGRYQTWVSIPLDERDVILSPRMVDLYLAWSDDSSAAIRYDGAVLLDKRYQAPVFDIVRQISFGDQIQLEGYQIAIDERSIALDLWWTPLDQIEEDWVLTVQLFDQIGNLVAQTDGLPAGYPPSRWVEGTTFVDNRTLSWDVELPADQYNVMLAWYRLEDGERLPITSETAINQIVLLETVYISR